MSTARNQLPAKRTRIADRYMAIIRQKAAAMQNKMFAEMYVEANERYINGDPVLFEFIEQLERVPVSIEEFMSSKEFLAATGVTIWPEVRKTIIEIYRDWWRGLEGGAYEEVILAGACVDADTEFLTPSGWKRIADYQKGDLVMQYHADGTATFIEPEKFVKFECDSFLRFRPRTGIDMALTPGHRVIYRVHKSGRLAELPAEDVAERHNSTKHGFNGRFICAVDNAGGPGIPLSDDEIRLMVAVHADGSFYERTNWCNIILKKERKISRLRQLLARCGIEFVENPHDGGEYRRFKFHAPQRNKTYEGWMACTQKQLAVVTDEVLYWDGQSSGANRRFFTAKKEEADFIQYAFMSTGIRASVSYVDRAGQPGKENSVGEYIVNICQGSEYTMKSSPKGPDVLVEQLGDGYCYCFKVPTGMWVMRRNGRVVVTGNTGTAKTFISTVLGLYTLYLLTCMKNPQKWYGLTSATSIVLPILAAKPNVMKKVVYLPFRKLLEGMPYFQKYSMPDKLIEAEMYFQDKNIRVVPAGSDEDAVLGEAVIWSLIDEINFMQVVMKSRKAEVTSGRSGAYDQAAQAHGALLARRKGRFTRPGPFIGMTISSSSTKYKGDFTDRRIAHIQRAGITTCYVYRRKQYEVAPQERYSGKKFRLLIGNDVQHDIRVLDDHETVMDGAWVEEVPIEYKTAFLADPYRNLRDIMGISHNAISPFIKTRYKIMECIEFGKELGIQSFLERDHVILGEHGLPRVRDGHYCLNPSKPRYVHIDLSRTSDRVGIAMLCFDGLIDIRRQSGPVDQLPLARLEMACTIKPDVNNEVDIAEIRSFVLALKTRYGYPIKGVSYDGFDSRESVQTFRKLGIQSREISMDKSALPYIQLRDALYDRRLALPEDDLLVTELFELEFDATKGSHGKVDHPVSGSKDLSDAVCGAYTNMLERRSTWAVLAVGEGMEGRAGDSERYDGDRR